MKTIVAVLVSFVILFVGWSAISYILGLIGYVAAEGMQRIGLIHLIYILFVWFISPAIGAFFAIVVTNRLFTTVELKTLYVSFVSVSATVVTFTFILGLNMPDQGDSGMLNKVGIVLQVAAIFVGAYIGKKYSEGRWQQSIAS
jgi:hypothetical protein